MTETLCPSCRSASPDNLLCKRCTDRLLGDLHQLAQLWPELQVTYRRQSQSGEDKTTRAHDIPMPYDHDAATVRDSVVNTIGTWIRTLSLGEKDLDDLGDTVQAWCQWLSRRIERIRGHEAADEIVDQIHYCLGIVKHAIDPVSDAIYCGECTICGKRLYAMPEADKAVCRQCAWIGVDSTLPVPPPRADAWKKAEAKLLTRAQVIEALTYNGFEVKAPTFRSWVHRDRLQAQGYQRNGAPLYLLGDAMGLARALALVPDQSKETMAG